ncbi:MAG: Mur ligase domain-containing protein, partial [Victivallales bacterium]|nr:Mur ligase domain-containing protein [Victivallales bacterium]
MNAGGNNSGDLAVPEHIHFVGIGGAGTAPLAGIMLARGCRVSGSDLIANARTEELEKRGARIFSGHGRANIPVALQLLVYSSAADADNVEILEARKRRIPC